MKGVSYIVKAAIIILLILAIMVTAHAQLGSGGPGSGAPGTPGVSGDNVVPFDGELSLILLAA